MKWTAPPLDFSTPLAKAQAAWARENKFGKHHACGCITRFDLDSWSSVTFHWCAFHAALGGGAR